MKRKKHIYGHFVHAKTKCMHSILCACIWWGGFLSAGSAFAQNYAVKTNTLFWAVATPNIALEAAFNHKITADMQVAYNPWTYSDDRKLRFWLVQPEVRYWFCEKFEGHFLGVHLHGAQYFGGFGSTRYDGYLTGGGLTYGYNWILSAHWNLEAVVGGGYARLWYDESPRISCLKCKTSYVRNYFGLTKAAISFVYTF